MPETSAYPRRVIDRMLDEKPFRAGRRHPEGGELAPDHEDLRRVLIGGEDEPIGDPLVRNSTTIAFALVFSRAKDGRRIDEA